jgi:hypothetical protein
LRDFAIRMALSGPESPTLPEGEYGSV